ncbi:HEPN domain-containing protein [Candidatus Woesearchaeota archaeon]|nr:HEPN domain-containing protein [Candidatus Woesearchaeota archaeon]
MKKFIKTLMRENKIQIVKETGNLVESYIEKSDTSLKSAELLFNNMLYETSVSMSYYAMYHITLAMLYKYTVKCENHTAAIMILKLIGEKDLSKKLHYAKKERIDKQYYADFSATSEDAEALLKDAKDFISKIKSKIIMLSNPEKKKLIEKLKEIKKGKKIKKSSDSSK